ncbi:MAG: DNA polymerase IV [Verrucomicrobiales bacterium]|nr:DNA polymerase IV [Verrucomicrobiales bacterium]
MRKILHIDMDCFYAAIEVRDHPELVGKPVAVGGRTRRGVLTTCNYEARRFGCRSAMPTWKAMELCPGLLMMPVRFDVYRRVSGEIREVFGEFTEVIEPLSLDEAYLDVSALNSSGAAIAKEVRHRIRERTGLAASAGIAGNKLLAKIASDWNKPDGQFEVEADGVDAFMRELPVGRLWGVGKKTEARIVAAGAMTCGDLRGMAKADLVRRFGKFGLDLYEQCRGLDDRPVRTHRVRKSLANERTYGENLESLEACAEKLAVLLDEEEADLKGKAVERRVKSVYVKVKFADFTKTTAERGTGRFDREACGELLAEAWGRGGGKAVRLLGVGVRFVDEEKDDMGQLDLGFG